MAFVHFIELFRTGRSAYLQGLKHSIWVVSNCNFYYVYSLLAILFVVVLGVDGYKLNPASAAKKLYNGNGNLDLFMRTVSSGRRFCSGAGKLGVDKVVELSQIQVCFGWWDFWKGFDSWSFKNFHPSFLHWFFFRKDDDDEDGNLYFGNMIFFCMSWKLRANQVLIRSGHSWSTRMFHACIITLSCCDSFEFFFLIYTNVFWNLFFFLTCTKLAGEY